MQFENPQAAAHDAGTILQWIADRGNGKRSRTLHEQARASVEKLLRALNGGSCNSGQLAELRRGFDRIDNFLPVKNEG